MKIKNILLGLLLIAALMLSACSPKTTPTTGAQAATTKAEEAAATTDSAKETASTEAEESESPVTEEEATASPETSAAASEDAASSDTSDGKLQSPFLVTTCGQSTGSVMFHMVATQAGLTSVDEHQLLEREMDELAGDTKTLVITTGTSGKGMGAAGTDVDDEIERCTAVAKKAKEMGLTVVCAHIEGMSRRTDASDQASIDAILPLADIIVCVEDSNSDNYFSDYASANNVPIIIVPDSLALSEYME